MSNITDSHDELTFAEIDDVTPKHVYTIASAPVWKVTEDELSAGDAQGLNSTMKHEDKRILDIFKMTHGVACNVPPDNRLIKKVRQRRAKNKAARKARRKNRK